jgi:uncharacterized protein YdhG (YjbR/CyaY superfamily)
MVVIFFSFAGTTRKREEIDRGIKNYLKGFSTSKGTIHFPTDKPMPVVLIKRMVRARVDESKKRG